MDKRFALLFFGILFLGYIFAADTFTEVSVFDQRTFEEQTRSSLGNPLIAISELKDKEADYKGRFDWGDGKTFEKSNNWLLGRDDDIKLSVIPTYKYVSFVYNDKKMVDLVLINKKNLSQSFMTGVFDIMVVDYTKNPDGTERIQEDILGNPPRLLFFRVKEEQKVSVTIPGVVKFNKFSIDETLYLFTDGLIEDFQYTFDDSFYNSLPKLMENRKNRVQQQAQSACTTIAGCLAHID